MATTSSPSAILTADSATALLPSTRNPMHERDGDWLKTSPRDIKTPRRGSYRAAPFTRQFTTGPEAALEAQLDAGDVRQYAQAKLKSLVFQFPEGLPERLRSAVWRRFLIGLQHEGDSSCGLEEFMSTGSLDETNQRVIRNDVERTRAHIAIFRTDEGRRTMEQMLTFFCKTQKIKYKQGLNEVLAPFFFLQSSEFGFVDVYRCFSGFINKFLLLFADDEFTTLQCSFHLFTHLLIYHDPCLSYFLEYHGISPELYVTPWFLTVFASKTQINHLLCLWDFYIAEGDRFFFCFIALALLLYHRDEFLSTEISQLPETLAQIGIRSFSELRKIWRLAKLLKQETPSSFSVRMSIAQGSSPSPAVSVLRRTLQQLESDRAFYILPQEVLRHCYGLHLHDASSVNVPFRLWKLLVLDIRTKQQFESGRLPLALNLDMGDGGWKRRIVELTAATRAGAPSSAGRHTLEESIAVMSSDSLTVPSDSHSIRRLRRRSAGDTGSDQDSTLLTRPHEAYDSTPNYHICILAAEASEQETGFAMHVHDVLTRELFLRWVSIVRGGHKEVHHLALQLGLELVDHQSTVCSLCAPPETVGQGDILPKLKKAGTMLFAGFKRQAPTAVSPSQQRHPDSSPSLLLEPPAQSSMRSRSVNLPESPIASPSYTAQCQEQRRRSLSPHSHISEHSRTRENGLGPNATHAIPKFSTGECDFQQPQVPIGPNIGGASSQFSLMGAFRAVRPSFTTDKNRQEDSTVFSNLRVVSFDAPQEHRTVVDATPSTSTASSRGSAKLNRSMTARFCSSAWGRKATICGISAVGSSTGTTPTTDGSSSGNRGLMSHLLSSSRRRLNSVTIEKPVKGRTSSTIPSSLLSSLCLDPHAPATSPSVQQEHHSLDIQTTAAGTNTELASCVSLPVLSVLGDDATLLQPLLTTPHFISTPMTSDCSAYSVCHIESEHWRILQKRFQRMLWPEIEDPSEMNLFPCWIESLKLDEACKRALLEVSEKKENHEYSQHRSRTGESDEYDGPTDRATTMLAEETRATLLSSPLRVKRSGTQVVPLHAYSSFERLQTKVRLWKGSEDEERRKKRSNDSKRQSITDFAPLHTSIVLSSVQSLSDLSFVVPDTRVCYLIIAKEELAITSMAYTTPQATVPAAVETTGMTPEQGLSFLRRAVTVGLNPSSISSSTPPASAPPSFALVYARQVISECTKIVPKDGATNTFHFYFKDETEFPGLSLRFRDDGIASQCVGRIEGLRAMK